MRTLGLSLAGKRGCFLGLGGGESTQAKMPARQLSFNFYSNDHKRARHAKQTNKQKSFHRASPTSCAANDGTPAAEMTTVKSDGNRLDGTTSPVQPWQPGEQNPASR